MIWILEPFLSRFHWYRRLRGGHWERWVIDLRVHGDRLHQVWFRFDTCNAEHRIVEERELGFWRVIDPPPLGRGKPVCEDWG